MTVQQTIPIDKIKDFIMEVKNAAVTFKVQRPSTRQRHIQIRGCFCNFNLVNLDFITWDTRD